MEEVETTVDFKEAAENFEEVLDEVTADTQETKEVVEDTLNNFDERQVQFEKEMDKQKAELFQKHVAFELKSSGLEQFADVINVTDAEQLEAVIQKLTTITNGIKVSAGYVPPQENAKQSEYDIHAQNKDTKGMIASKLSQLFK